MATFPVIRGGSTVLYPLTDAQGPQAAVQRFIGGQEQRWQSFRSRKRFRLEYRNLTGYEASEIADFYRQVKGAFDSTNEITIGGVTYQNMAVASDLEAWREDRFPDRQSLGLDLIQTEGA